MVIYWQLKYFGQVYPGLDLRRVSTCSGLREWMGFTEIRGALGEVIEGEWKKQD